ncbi:MAG: Fe-S-containing protein [Deltaproteobacteria bacterium]|jgi:uncharacterized membrane protein|nr:Fe-S-containing protein [Deltaproteobacteria bacterium]
MLMYLINVVDNAWVLAVGAPIVLHLLRLDVSRRLVRRLVLGSMALGLVAAAFLAYFRLTTGWVVREYYDLGVLTPLVLALFCWLVASTVAQLGLERRLVSTIGLTVQGGAAAVVSGGAGLPPWSLSNPMGLFPGAAVRAATAFTLALGYCALVYRVGFVRHGLFLVILTPVLAAVFSLRPMKIRSPRTPLIVSGLVVLCLLTARVAPNLLLYPFEFGVGMESYFNLEYLAKVAGYSLGLLVMALVWLSVRFLAARAPARILKYFLILAALVLAGQLLLEAGQILAARRLVSRTIFSMVLFLLERKGIFLFAQTAVWALLAAFLIVRSRVTAPVGANPAVRRRMRASLRDDLRAGALLMLVMAVVILASTTLRAINSRGPVISEPEEITAENGRLILPLEAISDGNLHRHVYQTEDGTPVRFIVIKKSASAFGVGLDACDICGQSGYYQRGDQVICKLCDVVMNKSTIGFPGGCNPVPLEFSLTEGAMVIDPRNLEREVNRFK